jgi:hypothetical protein
VLRESVVRIGLAILGLALGLSCTASAHAELNWTLAAQTGKQSFLIPVGQTWNSGPEELRYLRVLMIKRSSPKTVQIASENEWEFNCVARTWRWVSSRAISDRGETFGSGGNEWTTTEWAPLKQDAMGYMSGFACGDTKPIGPVYPNLKAAIEALWKEQP